MTRKVHHTKRQVESRRKAMKRWKEGLAKAGLPIPTKEQYTTFASAYNMGYKTGYSNALHPKTQKSKWKPVLDALCRFKDPISFDEAIKLLGCTEKALQKHMDNYEYFPTNEDMHIAYEQEMETMKIIDEVCNKDKPEIVIKDVIEVSDEKAEELIIDYMKKHDRAVWVSELVQSLCIDLEQVIRVTDKLEAEKKLHEKF